MQDTHICSQSTLVASLLALFHRFYAQDRVLTRLKDGVLDLVKAVF